MDWEIGGTEFYSGAEISKPPKTETKFTSALSFAADGDYRDSSDSEDLSPRQTSSFTAAISELTIVEDQSRRNLRPRFPDALHNNSNSITSDKPSLIIRVKAQDTMVESAFGVEVLVYQGKRYSSNDISPLYKKDCRTWLWKGDARNNKKTIMSDNLQRGSSFSL